jgi:hypothetical protein
MFKKLKDSFKKYKVFLVAAVAVASVAFAGYKAATYESFKYVVELPFATVKLSPKACVNPTVISFFQAMGAPETVIPKLKSGKVIYTQDLPDIGKKKGDILEVCYDEDSWPGSAFMISDKGDSGAVQLPGK